MWKKCWNHHHHEDILISCWNSFLLYAIKWTQKHCGLCKKKNRTESLTKSYKLSVTLLTVVCVHFNSFEIFSHSFFFWLVGCCVFSWIILMVLDSFIFLDFFCCTHFNVSLFIFDVEKTKNYLFKLSLCCCVFL